MEIVYLYSFGMSLFDPRIRYLLKRRMWPRYWQDWRFLAARTESQKYRLDILGPSGIGKTFLTNNLMRLWGERVPKLMPEAVVSEQWEKVFKELLNRLGVGLQDEEKDWDRKLHRVTVFSQVMDFELNVIRYYGDQPLINCESLLRHRIGFFTNIAESSPDLARDLLKNRLVIFGTSDDPVDRSIRGLIRRGSPPQDQEEFGRAVSAEVKRLGAAEDVFRAIGLPVLTVNLDRPVGETVVEVDHFMRAHGLVRSKSRKIRQG